MFPYYTGRARGGGKGATTVVVGGGSGQDPTSMGYSFNNSLCYNNFDSGKPTSIVISLYLELSLYV